MGASNLLTRARSADDQGSRPPTLKSRQWETVMSTESTNATPWRSILISETAYGLALELDAMDEQVVPPLRSHLPEAHISLNPTWKTSAQNAIEKINNPAAKRRSDRTLWINSSS
jgi:hypothetical protein